MRTFYPGLDYVRFGAALSVTLYHLGFQEWARATDSTAAAIRTDLASIAPVISTGWVGVPIFFILSGFVIAFSAEGHSAGRFAIGRVARLYPAVWICAPLTAIAISSDPDVISRLLRSLTLLPWGPWVSGVYWTLAVEVIFYIIVAAVIAPRNPRALHYLGIALAVSGSLYWFLRVIDYTTGGHLHFVFEFSETPVGSLIPIGSACHFGLGLLLWSSVRNGLSFPRICLMFACLIAGLISTTASARFNLALNGEPATRILMAPAIYMVGTSAIILSVSYNAKITLIVGRYGSFGRTLGLLTYPLYLVHDEVGIRAIRALASLGGWLAFLLAFTFVMMLAWFALHGEQYPRRLIYAVFERKPTRGRAEADLP
jgi:peptidoglycan/LPS O-acetylase OafA/YrhL